MWWKYYVFLSVEGKQIATFPTDFTQPGKSLLEVPCTATVVNHVGRSRGAVARTDGL